MIVEGLVVTVKVKLWEKKVPDSLDCYPRQQNIIQGENPEEANMASTLPPPASGTAEVHSVAERRSFDVSSWHHSNSQTSHLPSLMRP